MRLPTRVIREWKTVTSTDDEEIVWIAVLDNGEFALCVDLPEARRAMDEEVVITDGLGRRIDDGQQPQADPPFDQHEAFPGPEPGDLLVDDRGLNADEWYQQEREQMRRLHERRRQ